MHPKALLAASILALTSAFPALAVQTTYTASLSGAAESPPNASPGTGLATVTFDDVANTMFISVNFSDLLGLVTASHIHCCTAVPGTGTAGVATTTPTFTDFPSGVMSGTYVHTFDMLSAASYNPAFLVNNSLADPAAAFAFLMAGAAAGEAYLNIHTSVVPGGEIRGFLAPIPEPETYALMLGGLAALGWAARRRRARPRGRPGEAEA
jgi:hypothetical protein